MPKLTALERLLALTSAWARLNRLDIGCSGIVYFKTQIANASTKGARFVTITISWSSLSGLDEVGSLSDDSISNGADSFVMLAFFFFFCGDVAVLSVGAPRFLETRLPALSICLATL
jgi:hypothetical protein